MEEQIVGVYFAIDNSASMKKEFEGERRIDLARQIPLSLLKLYEDDNSLLSNLLVGVTTFNTEASSILPLGEITQLRDLPIDLEAKGDTHFGTVFKELHNQIQSDFERLSGQGIKLKPAVFFITDGRPNDEIQIRHEAYVKLRPSLSSKQRPPIEPQIIMCGIDIVKLEILERYASKPNYVLKADENLSIAMQIQMIVNSISRSVSASMAKFNSHDDDEDDPIDFKLPEVEDFVW
jgi:uncharacterized protein YegL